MRSFVLKISLIELSPLFYQHVATYYALPAVGWLVTLTVGIVSIFPTGGY